MGTERINFWKSLGCLICHHLNCKYIYILFQFFGSKIGWLVALPFWLNLLFNFIFTPIQFGLRSNRLALVDILLILITLIWAMIVILPIAWLTALAYLPYLIWVGIATALQISVTYLNN
jgi:tryptophan-rich sensory protein